MTQRNVALVMSEEKRRPVLGCSDEEKWAALSNMTCARIKKISEI